MMPAKDAKAKWDQFELHGFWVPIQEPPSERLKNLKDSLRLYWGDKIKAADVSRFFVSVASGELIDPTFSHYAIEHVQVFFRVRPRAKGDRTIVSLIRQRIFHYDQPVTKQLVPELSDVTPREPYVEWAFDLEENIVSCSLVRPGPKSREEHERNTRKAKQLYDDIYSRDFDDGMKALRRRGGARNVKVANLSPEVKKSLGVKYLQLLNSLTNVKRDAKTFASVSDDWCSLILKKYPTIMGHDDLLKHIDPHYIPKDPDASEKVLAPWEIAIEIAAREVIPNYKHNSAGAYALKNAATPPEDSD